MSNIRPFIHKLCALITAEDFTQEYLESRNVYHFAIGENLSAELIRWNYNIFSNRKDGGDYWLHLGGCREELADAERRAFDASFKILDDARDAKRNAEQTIKKASVISRIMAYVGPYVDKK